MNIDTGQTTEWLEPDDAEIIRETLTDEFGYGLGEREVFVLARSEDEYADFKKVYEAGLNALGIYSYNETAEGDPLRFSVNVNATIPAGSVVVVGPNGIESVIHDINITETSS